MRKLSMRRKESKEKQQIHGWDDLFCLSTPSGAASLHRQNALEQTRARLLGMYEVMRLER